MPDSAVAVRTDLSITQAQSTFTDFQVATLRQLGLENANDGDLQVFFHRCRVSGLDPFLDEICMIGRNAKIDGRWVKRYTVQVQVAGQRKLADRTGQYLGITRAQWCGPDGVWIEFWPHDYPPTAARAGVLRKGWPEPVDPVVMWREYVQTKSSDGEVTSMWAAKPALMLAKCARAAAFREAFPVEFAGMYIEDEMPADQPVEQLPAGRPGDILARAAGLDVDADPDLEEPLVDELITEPQSKMMHALFGEKGFKGREDRLGYVTDVLGFDVASSKDLTKYQAGQVIDALQKLAP